MTEKTLADELIAAAGLLRLAPMRQLGYASLEDTDRHAIAALLVQAAESIKKRRSTIEETVRGFQDRQKVIDAN